MIVTKRRLSGQVDAWEIRDMDLCPSTVKTIINRLLFKVKSDSPKMTLRSMQCSQPNNSFKKVKLMIKYI